MSYLRLAAHTASAGIRTVVRRTFHGPALPSWSFSLELAVEVIRAALEVGITMDPKRARKMMQSGLPGASVKKQVTFREEPLNGVPAHCVEPVHGASDCVLLFFLGGGYVLHDSVKSHGDMIARLTLATGCRTWVAEYRLAPEHPFPAALDDALAAYSVLLDRAVDPSSIAVGGSSAGGGLSLAMLLRLREMGRPLPAAAVVISPWVDHALTAKTLETNSKTDLLSRAILEYFSEEYRAGEDPRNPLVSPVYADLKGLPPLLMHAGGAEILLDDARRLADASRAAGVAVTYEVYDEMPHEWQALAQFVPEGPRSIEAIGRFVREKTAGA